VAYDRTTEKIEKIRANARRLGLENVTVATGDARRVRPAPAAAVLLDAPCSGLGVLSRRPDLRWRKSAADLPRLQRLQLDLLHAAARLVAPGGRLVYSVCSFEPEETSAVVEAFARTAGFEPDGTSLPERLQAGPGILYSLPQRHGMDGGFVACWRRTGG
jgi:16S rRNA (cytosine967-C5)-methyltransferase